MGVGFPSLISTCPQKTDRLHWAIGGGSGGFVGRDVGIDRGDVGKSCSSAWPPTSACT